MLKSYLKKIYEIANRGDAREESYYSTLETLLKEYTESVGKRNIHITTLPKKTEAGNPDFRIWDGMQHIVGYIEAKAPTVDSLDLIEDSEQLERYRHTFPNLILTNFFEFRLYRNGDLMDKVLIGRPFIAHKLKTIPPVEKEFDFLKLLENFFLFALPRVYDAKSLAVELAKRTRFLKDEAIAQELKEGKSFILGFYEAFREYLLCGLSKEEFADLYSQTITYGLFAARTRTENGFNRKLAYDNIPHTIGILRDVFKFISLGDLPQQMEWIIDDISEVLSVTDVNKILHQYFREGKGNDPIVHFYETFLAEYDPQTREKRGVYYTPEPVVSYIVRSLHLMLKEHFNRTDGFASAPVTVLDPAAGTLTFLAEATNLAVKEFVSKYGEGGKENFIREHILENFYAFELMMAPYAVGHLKMSFLLEELGYKLQKDDRFKLYLTNTLEMEELAQTEIPGMASLSEESHLAGKVKKKQPILVILGNPPYSGHSSNVGDWISKEIKVYYQVDGKPLGEKNPKWLQDDYVKFIRFAQWKIDQAGEGVLGFITNHSYLDNPTFRGMRQSLMNSFNEIYVLDLHGNSLKKETCPNGSKDENVFDIRQGVAIALFIKRKGEKKGCRVYHSEIWGLWKPDKHDWLLENDIKTTNWWELSPKSEFYLFIPRDDRLLESYEKYPKITGIFPVNSVGIVTSRDSFVIDFDKEALKRRIRMFRDEKMQDEIIRQTFKLEDKSNWKLNVARERVREDENWEDAITQILYRPFDVRWIFYHDEVIERSRKEAMRHMMSGNLGLITNRQIRTEKINHTWVANILVDLHIMETANASAYLFPLYLYPDTDPKDLFSHTKDLEKRQPNINPEIFAALSEVYKKEPTPEEIFYYIYAVLYSNIYRTKYAEFLKIDFPRIPFTKDYELFGKMAEYGERLVDLHLSACSSDFSRSLPSQKRLKSLLQVPLAKFQGKGDNKVEKLRYDEKEGRVYINQSQTFVKSLIKKGFQYFEGIAEEVWQYQIGGYQVCDKWLKDRKGKPLSLDEMKQYCRIVTSLQKTIEIQKEIDNIYPEVERL
ncbi:DNA methyltransferase [Candidatus Poribacteria bacterium]|nr:DNA methyltransferase [Candidatus Poribacteria bacterium]